MLIAPRPQTEVWRQFTENSLVWER
uniref:Uncharacterized protein n=1 Tax=Anguilla anguilla TaxID=7936 RepID=A0A0E9VAJ6_ANGAN